MIKIQFSALLDGVSAKKDRTLSVKLGTQELTADEASFLLDCMGKQLWIAIAETPLESLEIPEVLPEMQGEKTPAQRLRGILYRIWELKTDKTQTFPRFYEDYISKI